MIEKILVSDEQLLGIKATLCLEFAGENKTLADSLFNSDYLLYHVKYENGETDLLLDCTKPFPKTYLEYKDVVADAYKNDGMAFIQADYWVC